MELKAPFPYFGGKRRAAGSVWQRLGKVSIYVEPFAGSLAVLLANPHTTRYEIVNDLDGLVTNFWRSVRDDPKSVAAYADLPMNEIEIYSRFWAQQNDTTLAERLYENMDYYDPKLAGWWLYCICAWTGAYDHLINPGKKLPSVINSRGIFRVTDADRSEYILETMQALSTRLREVRIACGDWSRVVSSSILKRPGLTGVFFDPPYDVTDRVAVYKHESHCSGDVRDWCLENGDRPNLRIALCGYAGEGHEVLEDHGWDVVAWKTSGGYSSAKQGVANAVRERIWFSPNCLDPVPTLLGVSECV